MRLDTLYTVRDGVINWEDSGGRITITPHSKDTVQMNSGSYTVNGVEYRFTVNAVQTVVGWSLAYFNGDRSVWRSRADWGMTRSAEQKLRSWVLEILNDYITPGIDGEFRDLFTSADSTKRERDAASLHRQIEDREREIRILSLELQSLHDGNDYQTYPL